MSEQNAGSGEIIEVPDGDVGGITFPLEKDQFAQFVKGLLGRPQTMTRRFGGIFAIDHDDIINTFELVDQRIRQQNEASLVEFNTQIIFSDDSSVLLSGIDAFRHYSEIRPIVSVAIILSWTYLIKFQNKEVPEKQQIDLYFQGSSAKSDLSILRGTAFFQSDERAMPWSNVSLRISHTERTWGADIDSLLTGHVNTFLTVSKGYRKFLQVFDDVIGFVFGSLFFISGVVGTLYSRESSEAALHRELASKLSAMAEQNAIMAEQLNFLVQFAMIEVSPWKNILGFTLVFMLLFLSVLVGFVVSAKVGAEDESYVLLTKRAKEEKDNADSQVKRDWVLFALTILGSVIASFVVTLLLRNYVDIF